MTAGQIGILESWKEVQLPPSNWSGSEIPIGSRSLSAWMGEDINFFRHIQPEKEHLPRWRPQWMEFFVPDWSSYYRYWNVNLKILAWCHIAPSVSWIRVNTNRDPNLSLFTQRTRLNSKLSAPFWRCLHSTPPEHMCPLQNAKTESHFKTHENSIEIRVAKRHEGKIAVMCLFCSMFGAYSKQVKHNTCHPIPVK